jgi:hypothetical protein
MKRAILVIVLLVAGGMISGNVIATQPHRSWPFFLIGPALTAIGGWLFATWFLPRSGDGE